MVTMDIPDNQHNLFHTKGNRVILCHCLTGPWGPHMAARLKGQKLGFQRNQKIFVLVIVLILSMAKLFLISRLRQSSQVH